MSWQERKISRREALKWTISLISGLVVGAPLAGKSAEDAKALSKTSRSVKDAPKSQPPTPELAETEKLAESKTEVKTGTELLKKLGLQGKVVYIVYGRPKKYEGQKTWGSLEASRTAEESWQVFQKRRAVINQVIGKIDEDFALNVLNPVYSSGDGAIKDIYIRKALELAPGNQGVVAINFNSTSEASKTLRKLESVLPKELLAYLAVGLDIEHFPNHKAEASSLNEFSAWFAQKHQEWAGDSSIPGLVLIYTLHGSEERGEMGRILNLGELVQYYLPQKTLVVPIFDGYGTKEAKFNKMADLVELLPNTHEFPALLGVMEFRSKWGGKYDQASIKEIFTTLRDAPVFFFASQ